MVCYFGRELFGCVGKMSERRLARGTYGWPQKNARVGAAVKGLRRREKSDDEGWRPVEGEKKKSKRGGVGGWRLPSGHEKKNVRVSVFCVFGSLSPKLQNDPPFRIC